MHEKRFGGGIERLRDRERVERLAVERVVAICLEHGPISSVLDVGTGTGLFAEEFSKRGRQVAGLDVNPEMLAEARRFVPEAEFQEGTVEALPFDDGSFELVFLGLVLHESDETLKTLQEALRVARKRVCILEWPYRDGSFGPPLAHRLKPEELAVLFQQAGYRNWKKTDFSDTVLYSLEV